MHTTYFHDPEKRITQQRIAFGKAVEASIAALALEHLGTRVYFAAVIDMTPGSRDVETMMVTNIPQPQAAYGLMAGHMFEGNDPGAARIQMEEPR